MTMYGSRLAVLGIAAAFALAPVAASAQSGNDANGNGSSVDERIDLALGTLGNFGNLDLAKFLTEIPDLPRPNHGPQPFLQQPEDAQIDFTPPGTTDSITPRGVK